MKRDLELIRNMLLFIEGQGLDVRLEVNDFLGLNPSRDIIAYHLYLLANAGYIECTQLPVLGTRYPKTIVKWLTPAGCDYLDSVRDASVWNKTKEKLVAVGGQASLDIVKDLAVHVARSFLGI